MQKRRWTSDEIAAYRKAHENVFYCNREDSNILVPKAYGFGFTFNWANPLTWVCLAALVAIVVCIKVFIQQ